MTNTHTAPWTRYALCREIPGDIFFPEPGQDWKEPVKACQACPVRLLCLDEAMRDELGHDRKLRWGVWAGLTPRQRKDYEPQWLAQQAEEVAAA